MAHAWIRGQLTPERPQRGCQLDGRLPIAGRMKIGRLGTGYRVLVRPVPAVRSEELPTGRSGSVSCSGFGALRHCHQHCHDPVRHCPRLSGRPLFSGPWGGGGRIRTLDGLPPSGFQNRCNRPLCHASFQPAAPLTDADFTEQFTYHGVLAPASAWRDLVVPRHTTAPAAHFHGTRAPNSPTAPSSCARSRSSRSSWAELLRRVFAVDVLTCPHCGGPRRLIAQLTDPIVVRRILGHLGLPTEPPRSAPARSPEQFDFA